MLWIWHGRKVTSSIGLDPASSTVAALIRSSSSSSLMTNKRKDGNWPGWVELTLILGPFVFAVAYNALTCGGGVGFLKSLNAIGLGLWSITLSAAWLIYKNNERRGERELLAMPKEKGATAVMVEAWNARYAAAHERVLNGKVGLLAVQRTVSVLAIVFGAMRVVMYMCGIGI